MCMWCRCSYYNTFVNEIPQAIIICLCKDRTTNLQSHSLESDITRDVVFVNKEPGGNFIATYYSPLLKIGILTQCPYCIAWGVKSACMYTICTNNSLHKNLVNGHLV